MEALVKVRATISAVEGGPLHGFLELLVEEGSMQDALKLKLDPSTPPIQVISFSNPSQISEVGTEIFNRMGLVTRAYLDADQMESIDELPAALLRFSSICLVTTKPILLPYRCTEVVYKAKFPCTAVPLLPASKEPVWKLLQMQRKPKQAVDYLPLFRKFPDWRIEGPGMPRMKL